MDQKKIFIPFLLFMIVILVGCNKGDSIEVSEVLPAVLSAETGILQGSWFAAGNSHSHQSCFTSNIYRRSGYGSACCRKSQSVSWLQIQLSDYPPDSLV